MDNQNTLPDTDIQIKKTWSRPEVDLFSSGEIQNGTFMKAPEGLPTYLGRSGGLS